MTCAACAKKVNSAFLKHPDVLLADVSQQKGTASVEADKEPERNQLDKLLEGAGQYRITGVTKGGEQITGSDSHTSAGSEPDASSTWDVYKPLVLIFLYVSGIAVVASHAGQYFSWYTWMQYFMAGFFIVFSFFKLLDLHGFARSYAMYDLLAQKWKGYGYIYPFLELSLGILYLTAVNLPATHAATIVIMGFSSIGVIRNLLSPNKVKCACLGTVFKLPLGHVTLVEDLLMVAMAGLMLVTH